MHNPLRQNQGHLRAAAAFLDLSPRALKSIVFFVGDAQLKKDVGPQVLVRSGLVEHIQLNTTPILESATVDRCNQTLRQLQRSTPWLSTRIGHVRRVKGARALAKRRTANRRSTKRRYRRGGFN